MGVVVAYRFLNNKFLNENIFEFLQSQTKKWLVNP